MNTHCLILIEHVVYELTDSASLWFNTDVQTKHPCVNLYHYIFSNTRGKHTKTRVPVQWIHTAPSPFKLKLLAIHINRKQNGPNVLVDLEGQGGRPSPIWFKWFLFLWSFLDNFTKYWAGALTPLILRNPECGPAVADLHRKISGVSPPPPPLLHEPKCRIGAPIPG